MKRAFVQVLVLCCLLHIPLLSRAELKEFHSLYNFVSVELSGDVVTFRYKYNGARMSSIDLTNEAYQVIPYTRYLFSPAFLHKHPAKALLIGLGAGAYNRLHNVAFPDSELTTVEIDSLVLTLAKKYANFVETDQNTVTIQDARIFLARTEKTWDWILFDAFDIEANIPPHLSTVEFYTIVSEHLADDGAFALNLHDSKPLFYSQLATLKAVFPQMIIFPVPQTGNVIVLCSPGPDVDLLSFIRQIDPAELPDLVRYGVDFKEMQAQSSSVEQVLPGKRAIVLTDDFAPVEMLAK